MASSALLDAAFVNVLGEVRCQLRLRAFGPGEGQPSAAWTQEQWFEAFDFLFMPHKGHQGAHLKSHDDLLFFVHSRAAQLQAVPVPGLDNNGMPFSVRRRTHQLAPEWQKSGSNFTAIAWDETLLLNLVIQTEYTLTVVVCRQELLAQVAAGMASPTQVLSVTKRVFASPVSVTVNMDKPDSRSSDNATASCYPDVCFAVENFDDAFSEMVISSSEDCYCVTMHALLPEAQTTQPAARSQHQQSPAEADAPPCTLPSTSAAQSESLYAAQSQTAVRPNRLVLFSGYVTYQQVAGHLETKRSAVGRLLGGESREKVLMAGPGGMGFAEVAVQKQRKVPAPEGSPAGKPVPRGGPLQAVFGVLSAIFLEEPEQTGVRGGAGVDRLQCALMCMQLPVGKLALNLLDAVL